MSEYTVIDVRDGLRLVVYPDQEAAYLTADSTGPCDLSINGTLTPREHFRVTIDYSYTFDNEDPGEYTADLELDADTALELARGLVEAAEEITREPAGVRTYIPEETLEDVVAGLIAEDLVLPDPGTGENEVPDR